MKDKIKGLIGEWEVISEGFVSEKAIKTAAFLSNFTDVPQEVLNALEKLEIGEGNKSRNIFLLVSHNAPDKRVA